MVPADRFLPKRERTKVNKMKKAISAVLAAAMVLGLAANAAAADVKTVEAGKLYMATAAACCSPEDRYNAVNLENGITCSFDYDDDVMPVHAKVVIE